MFDVILLLFGLLEPMFRTIFLPGCFLSISICRCFFCFFALVPVPIILVILIVVFGKGGVWWLGVAPRGRTPRGRSVWMMVSHVSVSLYGSTRPPGACSGISHQQVAFLVVTCMYCACRVLCVRTIAG